METKECNEFKELLDAFADGELAGAERERVGGHLASCGACSGALSEITMVSGDLKNLPALSPRRDLVDLIDFDSLGDPFDAMPADDRNPVTKPGCSELVEMLDAYHDNELDVKEREVVSQHLNGCQPCSLKLANISAVVRSLQSLPRVAPERDLAGTVSLEPAKVSPPAVELPSRGRVVSFITPKFVLAACAAAAVVMVAVAVNVTRPVSHSVAEQPVKNAPVVQKSETVPIQVAESPSVVQTSPVTSAVGESSGGVTQTNKGPVDVVKVASASGNDEGVVNHKTAPQVKAEERSILADAGLADAGSATAPSDSRTSNTNQHTNTVELAVLSDDNGSFQDAMGIAVDEDGLYDIKI